MATLQQTNFSKHFLNENVQIGYVFDYGVCVRDWLMEIIIGSHSGLVVEN